MKVFSFLLVFMFSCGFATIPNVIVEADSMIDSYSVRDLNVKDYVDCDIINNLIMCKVPNNWDKSQLVSKFKLHKLTEVYYNGEPQASGVSVQDYTSDTTIVAQNVLGDDIKYVVRVRYEKELLVTEVSPIIKITSINDLASYNIARAPSAELLNVPQEDILYCYNVALEDSLMLGMNNDLTKVSDFVCNEFYSYDNLVKQVEIQENPFFYNIVAVYDYEYYLYQRIYITENIELHTGACDNFVSSVVDNTNIVLGNNLNCEDITSDIVIGGLVLYGNGYNINNFINIFDSISNSFLYGLDFTNSKNIANELAFVRIERLNISNGYNHEIEDVGLVANKAFDLTIHNANVEGIVISDTGSSGLVTGLYVSNFPLFPFLFNDINISGISNSSFMSGGMFGFLISYAEIFNTNINVEVIGDNYSGCVYGENIDTPYLENVIEECY